MATETDEQTTLGEFHADGSSSGRGRCQAYADSTGERCQRESMNHFPYCGDHIHLLDTSELDTNV